jgi:hypothetical protein
MLKTVTNIIDASQIKTPITFVGDVTLSTGNLVIGTSGKGIDFTVTSSGSGTMTSELLADYEEGTWTATLTASTTGPTTPVTATGKYTKIGRQVTVTVDFSNVTTTGAAGIIIVNGLPYTTVGTTYGSLGFSGFGLVSGIAFVPNGVTYMLPIEQISLNNINIIAGTGKYLVFTASYFTS